MRLLLILSVLALAACGGGNGGSAPAPPRDTTPPLISLIGDNPLLVEAGTAYVEHGATASDNVDGDLTGSLVMDASAVDTSVPGDYTVSYEVTDASGNTGTAARTVSVRDTTPPEVTLLGDDPQVIVIGSPYTEFGATASDSLDGDLTGFVEINATAVDTSVPGDYPVTYDVDDAAGNAAVTVTRTVRVENPPLPLGPTVSVEGNIKTLIFEWTESDGADYYRLLENADGHSGFSPVVDDIPADTLTARREVAVHLFDWVEAQYLVEACNIGGCNSSDVVTVKDVMLDTIGYFKSSNSEAGDFFGGPPVALSADGQTLVVGVGREDSRAAGINGNQSDNSAVDSGAVYVFALAEGEWIQTDYIKASNPDAGDRFGGTIALSADGRVLAVGATGEDSGATEVDGDQSDNSFENAGAVYLFDLSGDEWQQVAYLKASMPSGPEPSFGSAIALNEDGTVVAVGVPNEDNCGEVTDEIDLLICDSAGAVYVYAHENSEWHQQAYLKHYAFPYEWFGQSVALDGSGTTLAVGAPGAGGWNYGSPQERGRTLMFTFDGGTWKSQASLPPLDPTGSAEYDRVGKTVALSADGKTVAFNMDIHTFTGPGGPYRDNNRAVIFQFDGLEWAEDAAVRASNGFSDGTDRFGDRVAISGDGQTLVVTATAEDSAATGANGDENDNSLSGAGAAYVYRLIDGAWVQEAYVKASNTDAGDGFGNALSISFDGRSLAIGAPGEDSSATGVDADEDDNSAPESGAVYIY